MWIPLETVRSSCMLCADKVWRDGMVSCEAFFALGQHVGSNTF